MYSRDCNVHIVQLLSLFIDAVDFNGNRLYTKKKSWLNDNYDCRNVYDNIVILHTSGRRQLLSLSTHGFATELIVLYFSRATVRNSYK